MASKSEGKPTGYDKFVNYKTLAIAVGAFVLILLLPTPESMRDVAVEYSAGGARVKDFLAQELFQERYNDIDQWQAVTVSVLEANLRQGALSRRTALRRDRSAIERMGIRAPAAHIERYTAFVESMEDGAFLDLMTRARALRYDELAYSSLNETERARADKAAFGLKLAVALVAFVVICFMTEAIPLPSVAFCVGIALVLGGVVTYREVASLYWADACWFIMGSLMFAAAFVKTGVDRRICLIVFKVLARPSLGAITFILILVIAPAAAFISDHALAAMFLPVAMILYTNSLNEKVGKDTELGKMLMICVAMACNIGGFGSPSGGARNVIMMTYMEDMFGITIGYGQWMLFAMPFVAIMIPVLWLLLRWRFKPKTSELSAALESLRADIAKMGGWSRKQIVAVVIFLVMVFGWVTDANLIESLLGFKLGLGVMAVMGAVAYLFAGVVNWRDYHERVDWGVVWLYAGAIIFGRTLDESGAAYWMARSVVDGLSAIGLDSNVALLGVGGAVTAGITNLMADGPAAAAVGPVTLNMAAVAAPGTTLIPYMGLITSCAASMAYLMIIGTPPNAIVYASGLLGPKDFLRVGIPCFIIAFVVMLLLALFYWPLLGFAGLRPM